MARTINMHTDLQISNCWEHISTWNMHELVKVDIFFINWTVRMSDNLPERVQILGHAHTFALLYGTTELSAVKYFAIYS
jgi:hypothetical protein